MKAEEFIKHFPEAEEVINEAREHAERVKRAAIDYAIKASNAPGFKFKDDEERNFVMDSIEAIFLDGAAMAVNDMLMAKAMRAINKERAINKSELN